MKFKQMMESFNCSRSTSIIQLCISVVIFICVCGEDVCGQGVQSCSNDTGSGSPGGLSPLSSDNTTSRSIPYEEFVDGIIYDECIKFIPEGKCDFFDYGGEYEDIAEKLELLSAVLSTSKTETDYCKEVLRSYVCNYVYPGYNTVRDTPQGVCTQECEAFVLEGTCKRGFKNFEVFVQTDDRFNFSLQCDNTLAFVDTYGFNFTDDPSDCYNISGTISSLEPDNVTVVEVTSTEVNQFTTVSMEQNTLLPLAYIVPISAGVIGAILLCSIIGVICVVCVCLRRKHRQRSFQDSSMVVMENQSNDYQLRSFFSEVVQECEEVPLFQLLSEDVDRLCNNSNLQEVMVPFEQLDILEEIAEGAFGRVYRGVFVRQADAKYMQGLGDMIEVAIKTIKDNQSQGSYQNIKGFIEESALMYSFHHPHVLGLIGISLDVNSSPYLILPYMENGDLRTFLKAKRELATKSTDTGYPEGLQYEMLVRICYEIACGMEYLASRKLVHRDLAARNCMVDRNISIKVADFGLTRDIYQTNYYSQRQHAKIPVKWMSPESLHDRISNEKTDVWSYGVTCWEVFSLGRMPYPTIPNHEILEYLEQGRKLKRPALCSDEMFDLMDTCWLEEPGHRPSFTDIVQTFKYILPEVNTHTHGAARYKIKVRTGSPESSLLTSIVSELKHTPRDSFHLDLEDDLSPEQPEYTSEILQQLSLQSIGNSYVYMNPLVDGILNSSSPQCFFNAYDEVDDTTGSIHDIQHSHQTVPGDHVRRKKHSSQSKEEATKVKNSRVRFRTENPVVKRTASSSSDYFPMYPAKQSARDHLTH